MLSKYGLYSLKNKLYRDPDFKREYHEILQERELLKKYTMRGYQEKLIICPTEQKKKTNKQTQVRIVFDGSAQRKAMIFRNFLHLKTHLRMTKK